MDISTISHHLVPSEVEVKTFVETSDESSQEGEEIDPMEIATTVTIVEEDGTTSVVEGAQVVSDPGRYVGSPTTASQQQVTYQVVTTEDIGSYVQSAQPTVQLGGSQYYVVSGAVARPQVLDVGRSLGRYSVVQKGSARDDKKRATHNEVERRRRDKINGWISKLAKIVPSCADESASKNQSKGGILAKACEYIGELKSTNCRLAATLKEHANTAEDLDALRREISELRKENMMLKQQLGPTEDDVTVTISTTE